MDDIEYGRSILRAEIEALNHVTSLLDSRFARAVDLISDAVPGSRIVVSGMGKAGFVAMKLSATLASIGFPSFFLHPADAVHGDLGRFSQNDIALLLSHSGETPEITRLLPTVKHFGASIISITSSASSTLGCHSDIVIETGKIPEAGPLGLAPTTSTTVMMVVGDALAMTLVKRRGFTREEFARFHPGGDLGRSLMTVTEIMRSGDAHCVVNSSMLTKDVLHAMTKTRGRPGAAAVVDDNQILIGVFTDGDLRRCLAENTAFLKNPISQVASMSPKTVSANRLATEAARIISELHIDQIIVVDDAHHPIGLIDIQDFLAYGMIKPPTQG